MKKLVIVFCLLLTQLTVKTQIAYDSIQIGGSNWGGIASVRDVLYDNSGNIWLAWLNSSSLSISGIKRFDGTNWIQYQTSNSGLPSNSVSSIKQDSQGNYWIGTGGGLVKFDGTNWTVYNQSNSGICANGVGPIEIDGDTIWAGTAVGISKFDGTNWTTYNNANSGLYPESTECLLKTQGKLYIGNSKGISILENDTVINYNKLFELNNRTARIISNSNFGIVLCNTKGVYRFVNGEYFDIETSLDLCPNSLANFINTSSEKVICNIPNNNLIINTSQYIKQINNYNYGLDYFITTAKSIYCFQNNLFLVKNIGSLKYVIKVDVNSLATSVISNNTLKNNCAQHKLDINQVSARMLPLGDMFWDLNSNPGYEVPKGSGSYAGFAGSIWIGGKVNNQLRTACQTYRQNGIDFWPGPLDTTDAKNPQGSQGGKILKVNRFDIENFIFNFNQGNVQSGNFFPSSGIMLWPAHDTGVFSRNTAPFVDVNNNGMYDPLTGGDYPKIKGDQELYHIYNDASGQHLETGSNGAMGIEIHQSSYAYTCDEIADSMSVLNYTTFYEFEIINRSDTLIDSMYVAFWNDSDLGNYQDDYVGCNVNENYGFIYQGDYYDDDGNGVIGYHDYLPCFSTAIIESPRAIINDGKDNNHNGFVDEQNEDVGMSSFLAYNNTGDAVTGNPTATGQGIQYYNYMQGKWRNGLTMKYGGSGTNGTISTSYQFPGTSDPIGYGVGGTISNPNPQPAWTETTAGIAPGDRRFLIGSGPFQLAAKDTTKIVYAMVFTIDSAVTGDITHNVIKSESDVKRIKAWYNNNNFPSCLDVSSVGVKELKPNELPVYVYPNPTNGLLTIQTEDFSNSTKIVVTDLLGKTLLHKQMNSQTEVINISEYESGIYFIKVYDNLKQKTIKIIKS